MMDAEGREFVTPGSTRENRIAAARLWPITNREPNAATPIHSTTPSEAFGSVRLDNKTNPPIKIAAVANKRVVP